MNALPIAARELLVRARAPQMYWIRLGYAAFGVLMCLQFLVLWMGMNLAQVGGYTFQTLAWMAFLAAGAGFVLTADSLSSERREGTLGLLLLTRLGLLDVLAGKLASAGASAVMGLTAIVPVFMMPVLAGGVRWTQVAMVAFSLPGLLFFSLCAGLWASSKSSRMGTTMVRSSLCVGLVNFGPLMLGKLQGTAGASELAGWIQSLSPGRAFILGTSQTGAFSEAGYWRALAVGFVYGAVLLMLAARHLRRSWRESGDRELAAGGRADRKCAPVGDQSPLRWMLQRSKGQSHLVWLGASLLILPRFATTVFSVFGVGVMGLYSALYFVTAISGCLAFSYAGAMFFLNGRRTGELELLRTTPVGSRTIVLDQWIVLRRRLTGPILAMLAVSFLLTGVGWGRVSGMGLGTHILPTILTFAGTVLDVLALCWLGMWFGYRSRTTWSALLWPVGLVAGLDLILSYAIWTTLGLLLSGAAFRGGWGTTFSMFLTSVPPLILIAKQIWLIRWSRRRLGGALVETGDLRPTLSLSARRVLAAVNRARHWTGGGS